jgi:hypothetical protein
VRESDFRPLEGSVQKLGKELFGFFEFAPSEKLDLDLVSRLIVAAREEVDSVDVVMVPENAVISDLPAEPQTAWLPAAEQPLRRNLNHCSFLSNTGLPRAGCYVKVAFVRLCSPGATMMHSCR